MEQRTEGGKSKARRTNQTKEEAPRNGDMRREERWKRITCEKEVDRAPLCVCVCLRVLIWFRVRVVAWRKKVICAGADARRRRRWGWSFKGIRFLESLFCSPTQKIKIKSIKKQIKNI